MSKSIINSFVIHCLLAAAAVVFAATAQATPVPVLSNLNSPASSDNGSLPVGKATGTNPGLFARAQGFTSGTNPLQLSVNRITLDLSGNNVTGTPLVQVWSSLANLPGTVLGTLTMSPATVAAGSDPALYDFTTANWIDLTANTNYWVVVRDAFPATGRFNWDYNGSFSPPTAVGGSGYASLGGALSSDNGGTWSASAQVQQLSIAVYAVPEPPTVVLAGLGVAAAFGHSLRRRKVREGADSASDLEISEEGVVALTA